MTQRLILNGEPDDSIDTYLTHGNYEANHPPKLEEKRPRNLGSIYDAIPIVV
jgi:hypothetical protein